MTRTEMIAIRCSPAERADLMAKAERCARTPSDFLRLLVSRVDLERLDIGVPSPALSETEGAEREVLAS